MNEMTFGIAAACILAGWPSEWTLSQTMEGLGRESVPVATLHDLHRPSVSAEIGFKDAFRVAR